MEKTLQRLGEVEIIPPPGPSKFVAPQTVMYHLDGTLTHSRISTSGQRVAWKSILQQYTGLHPAKRGMHKAIGMVVMMRRGGQSVGKKTLVSSVLKSVQKPTWHAGDDRM